jgi:hypothetical protein
MKTTFALLYRYSSISEYVKRHKYALYWIRGSHGRGDDDDDVFLGFDALYISM